MNLTYSGSDTLAFIVLPNTVPILLGSLTTFSYSSYRAKKPLATLGSIIPKGVMKGGRIIAGTMIFTIINKYWINEVMDLVPWLKNESNGVIYSDELPLFDILIIAANEYGSYVSMKITGVDITDEAGVMSINDMYTENTFSFIAREIKPYNTEKFTSKDLTYASNTFYTDIKKVVFKEEGVPEKINNNLTSNEEESIKVIENHIIESDIETLNKIFNKLIELGYDVYDESNQGIEFVDMIYEVFNRIYPNTEKDVEDFLNNEFPYITEEVYATAPNNFIITDEEVFFYSDKNTTDKISEPLPKGTIVTVLGEATATGGWELYYTTYGWVYKDSVNNIANIPAVGEIEAPGVTNMNILVTVDGQEVAKDKELIIPIDDFNNLVENLEVNIEELPDLDDSGFYTFITNILMEKEVSNNTIYKNTVKEEYITSNSKVSFEDRQKIVDEFKPTLMTFVIVNSEFGLFFTMKVRAE